MLELYKGMATAMCISPPWLHHNIYTGIYTSHAEEPKKEESWSGDGNFTCMYRGTYTNNEKCSRLYCANFTLSIKFHVLVDYI